MDTPPSRKKKITVKDGLGMNNGLGFHGNLCFGGICLINMFFSNCADFDLIVSKPPAFIFFKRKNDLILILSHL